MPSNCNQPNVYQCGEIADNLKHMNTNHTLCGAYHTTSLNTKFLETS